MQFLFGFLLSVISLFLILLILVQRGRGGGLTGALGGMGGQSAFGTKAGDTFTRVTIVSAAVWIVCAILAVKMLGGARGGPLGDANAVAPPANIPAAGAADGGAGLLDDLPSADDGAATSGTSEATTDDAAVGGGSLSGGGNTDAEADPAPE